MVCGCECPECRDTEACGGCGYAACSVRPRLTSAADFPYGAKGICYFALDGGVVRAVRTTGELRAAVEAGRAGTVKLYAVWPGKYRSDLFVVDDLDAIAARVGLVPA